MDIWYDALGRGLQACTAPGCPKAAPHPMSGEPEPAAAAPAAPSAFFRPFLERFAEWKAANPAKACACGCGKAVEPKRHHFEAGRVPRFIVGHRIRTKPGA
jgi:hypothetical protein